MIENKASFFARIEPCFSPEEINKIKLAYMLAKHGHRAQFRKEKDEAGENVRYFEHLRRVAINIMDIAMIMDSTIIIAAILHDSLEDTEDLTPEILELCFGSEVTRIVKVLSKTPKEGYIDRFKACRDWRPFLIKAADRLDNVKSLSQTPKEFKSRQIQETTEIYLPLFAQLVTMVPASMYKNVDRLRFEIIRELGALQA